MPADERKEADAHWADYLSKHLKRRAGDLVPVVIHPAEAPEGSLMVTVQLDKSAKHDYEVKYNEAGVRLIGRDKEKMLWLVYQFMSAVGTSDPRISVKELPPAVLSCRNDTVGDFAFEYRGIYTPSNANPDEMGIFASHHVDYDWGLWGHNLHKIFGDNPIPESAYALVDEARSEEQYCFSSAELYQAVESHIIDQFGYGNADDFARFCIMPNDNSEVCQCEACRNAGNTAESATPAVTAFIEKLAKRFPHHRFFTSGYSTTKQPPTHQLPSNVGVLMSALDVPLSADFTATPQGRKFDETYKSWKAATSCIYVWDYMRNFDDYLTPYPCLGLLQVRLRHFRDLGVRGMFYNGSGEDYATFDAMQTAALAGLLVCPDAAVPTFADEYFRRAYPRTAFRISKFYDEIEQKAYSNSKENPLEPYAGIAAAERSYLTRESFEAFCTGLDADAKHTSAEERKKLNKLLTALNFTRLEMLRLQNAPDRKAASAELLAGLEGYAAFPEMANYREAHGQLADYIKEWRTSPPWSDTSGDRLFKSSVKVLTANDSDSPAADPRTLTDGLRGFASDYHTGWTVSAQPQWECEIPALAGSAVTTLRVGLLHCRQWRIYLPKAVEVWQGSACIGKASPAAASSGAFSERTVISVPLNGYNSDVPVRLRLTQSDNKRSTLAIDEIGMY